MMANVSLSKEKFVFREKFLIREGRNQVFSNTYRMDMRNVR